MTRSHRKEYSDGWRPCAAVRLLEAVQELDPQSVAGAAQLHEQHHPREEARGGEADGAAADGFERRCGMGGSISKFEAEAKGWKLPWSESMVMKLELFLHGRPCCC